MSGGTPNVSWIGNATFKFRTFRICLGRTFVEKHDPLMSFLFYMTLSKFRLKNYRLTEVSLSWRTGVAKIIIYFFTNFHFQRGFVTRLKKEIFCVFGGRGGVGGGEGGEDFAVWTVLVIKKCYFKNVYEFLEIRVNAFVTKLSDNIGFHPPCWYPSDGHQHGVSLQRSINLGE